MCACVCVWGGGGGGGGGPTCVERGGGGRAIGIVKQILKPRIVGVGVGTWRGGGDIAWNLEWIVGVDVGTWNLELGTWRGEGGRHCVELGGGI